MCKTTTATTTKRVPQKATFTHSVFVYPLGGTSTSVKVLCVAIATLGVIFIVGADDETKKKYNNNARERDEKKTRWLFDGVSLLLGFFFSHSLLSMACLAE